MKLAYEVKRGGGSEQRQLPFVIGVIGDFSGTPPAPLPRLRDRRFVEVNSRTLAVFRESMAPHVPLTVENHLRQSAGPLSMEFDGRFGFDPPVVANSVKPLKDLLAVRQKLFDLLAQLATDPLLDAVVHRCLSDDSFQHRLQAELGLEGDPSRLPSAVAEVLAASGWTDDPWREWSGNIAACLATLLAFIAENKLALSRDSAVVVRAAIAGLEGAAGKQLDAILHHSDFQKIESAYRGLEYLISQCETFPGVIVRALSVSKRELLRDMQRAPEFDQSALFNRVYGELQTLGGQPFSLLVGIYQFGAHPEDVELLDRVSQVAASSHCLFLAGLDPRMLQCESFGELEIPRFLSHIFESSAYAKWNRFRLNDDSRYTALVLPRILLREPHQFEGAPLGDSGFIPYTEQIQQGSGILWGNAAFALAANLARQFAGCDFAAAAIGSESGGLVLGLPAHAAKSDYGDEVVCCPTEIAITDRRQVELSELGFITICHRKGTSDAIFFDLPTCFALPFASGANGTRADLLLSAQLENVLLASRFAHYLKCILRDKFGTFPKLPEWERFLNSWIKRYVGDDGSKPLLAGSVTIEYVAPGTTPRVIATLCPHFQNRGAAVTLRVVVALPQMRGVEW